MPASGAASKFLKSYKPKTFPAAATKQDADLISLTKSIITLSSKKTIKKDHLTNKTFNLSLNSTAFQIGETEESWVSSFSNNKIYDRQKVLYRERKRKWDFDRRQENSFDRLLKMCGRKLGVASTLHIFGKLGQETGTKEYKSILALIVEEARETDDHEVNLDQNYKAYQLFQSMMETGFPIEEEIYGTFLKYLIDEGMVQEFYFFSDILRDEKPASLPRLAYYEMVLCIRLNNEDKIKQLIHDYAICGGEDKHSFQESYLLALCESDCRRELLMILETFDITKASSEERLSDIFKSLGMLSLEAYAKKFLLELKTSGAELASLTNYIYDYSINIPNLAVEDVVSKIKLLHSEMEMKPTSTQYEKLIRHYYLPVL